MGQYKHFIIIKFVTEYLHVAITIPCAVIYLLFLLFLFTVETFNGVLIGVVAVVTLVLSAIVAVACALLFVWIR